MKLNTCIAKDTIVITQRASPLITLTNDTSVCEAVSVTLNASGGNSYKWYPASTLSNPSAAVTIASPISTTTYYVDVSGSGSCVSKDSVTVTVISKPVFSVSSDKPIICKGDSSTLTAGGGDLYLWSPASLLTNVTASKTQAFPSATTTYKVEITNRICNVTDSVFITLPVSNKPAYTISKSNDIDCVVSQATLNVTGGVKYLWSPSAGLSNATIKNPVVNINNTTTFSVAITSSEGCIVKDSIQVKVLNSNIQNGYIVPNSFTPNGDGLNDCFSVKHWGGVKEFSFSIYTRWGETIFHTNDTNGCWDGKFKNIELGSGTYVYYITAKTLCGDVVRKGTIVLIK